jgi:serine/threonine-protein kinase HipA
MRDSRITSLKSAQIKVIYLVGENIDKRRAHADALAGRLAHLMRGVYVDAATDIDSAVLSHAVRIAHYLYPTAYLSSASALLLTSSPDGRLFISGRRNQRTRIRSLEIIQNQTPPKPSTTGVVVRDDFGEVHVNASSPSFRFLEAFRLRSEHASAVTEQMRARMAERLLEEFGDPMTAADALWSLARANEWYREGELAERYIVARTRPPRTHLNKAALALTVAWHRSPIGRLQHDGHEWRWLPRASQHPSLVRATVPGKLPPFIESLLPEGWLAHVLSSRDERELLKHGKRYMSNIAIVSDRGDLASLPEDILESDLARFTDRGRFTGRYAGPTRGELEEGFEHNLAQLYARATMPRLSGIQIKAPMSLTTDGDLLAADGLPFTHILKPSGPAGFEALSPIEWCCLELGRAAGFLTPEVALVEMPDGMAPALVVQRFDIRRGHGDTRRLALEDFCSVLDQPSSAKYDGSIERVARALRALSTEARADLEILFRRAIFAWIVADGDMHLKNLALLRIVEPPARRFTSVRLAPLYDAVTTRVLPGLDRDRMALAINGRNDRLTASDFRSLGRTIELPTKTIEQILSDTVRLVRDAARELALPTIPLPEQSLVAVARMKQIVEERTSRLDTEQGL